MTSGEDLRADALADVHARAEALLDALGTETLGEPLGVRGWAFGFDRSRVRLGRCRFCLDRTTGRVVKTITLGAAHAAQGWTAEVEDTVRHEIAHALDFETRGRSGHDAAWRRWAVRCGATPRSCSRAPRPDDDASPYVGVCAACGHRHPFYRAVVRAYRCPQCRAPLAVVNRETGEAAPNRAAFVGTCPACGAAHAFARRPRRPVACAACCRAHARGRYDARFALALRAA